MQTPYTRENLIRGFITVLTLVALYFLIRRLSGVLLPFCISLLVAYQMVPLVNFFQYKCRMKNRTLSVITTLVVVIGVLVGAVLLVVPMIGKELVTLSEYVQEFVTNFNASDWLSPEIESYLENAIASMDINSLIHSDDVRAALQKIAPTLWGWVSGGMNMLSGLLVVFVCLMYIFFILIDHEQISESWPGLIPIRYRAKAQTLMTDFEQNMSAYFRGQASIAAIVGILFAIGFQIIGLPMGIVMGLIIGVLNFVPYMQALGIPFCILLGILQSVETGRPLWIVMLSIAAVFVVVQTTQDMVLTPKIMGGVTGMNPALMLLTLSIWGSLLGVIGMIIALPVTTLFVSYYKRFILKDEEMQNALQAEQ
ncbi:MAG: AI-2E family transporter [Paludibacteraceae bacterium]|nr:AI-2E family transporter [Paludibacteraceae bacterium]